MAIDKFDFSGYATKNDLKCSDGRVIIQDAFKDSDGRTVPLVWQHMHNEPGNILGHAMLKNIKDGVYAYCKFNNTDAGKNAKQLVEHGDITAMSIYANNLKQQGDNVIHGAIREVSLVITPANPGALIQNISFAHTDGSFDTDDSEAIIRTGENFSINDIVEHSAANIRTRVLPSGNIRTTKTTTENPVGDDEDDEDVTVKEVFDSLTEQQKNVVYAMIGQALTESEEDEDAKHSNNEGGNLMKRNIFDQKEEDKTDVLSHADMEVILKDAKRCGSLKESFLAHAQEYGIENIDYLFPEARNLNVPPISISREMDWVARVFGATSKTPFSRIKSLMADLREDEARARGYITGNRKTEEVFTLLKRTTTPQTIYKKQKLDRDDVVDITDFDVVAWIKREMRMLLDEEIARAILIGDGRLTSSEDKIKEDNIRPIWKDDSLYTIRRVIETPLEPGTGGNDAAARAFIRAAIRARIGYKGSGTPTLYTTEEVVTTLLLLEDSTGRIIYDSVDRLATVLRVREIVTVPVMENQTRTDNGTDYKLMGIIVNLTDYNVGADRGGAVNMFDDFDIDYNKYTYLIETRISGALIRPYSAIAIESVTTNAAG